MKAVLYLCLLWTFVSSCSVNVVASTKSSQSEIRAVVRRNSTSGDFWIDTNLFDDKGVAWGSFEDGLSTTGWGILNIETNNRFNDEDQAYAAGLLEGWLTARHIFQASRNMVSIVFKSGSMPEAVKHFLEKQDKWTRNMIKKHKNQDPLWLHMGYLLRQYDGLVDGYASRAPADVPFLPSWNLQMLNAVGDLFDIKPSVLPHMRENLTRMNRYELEFWHAQNTHCSAIIKVDGAYDDLFVSHSSWFTFASTDRIMKHYYLNYNHESTKSRRLSFSSYPGCLESIDDYYQLDSGLTWTQTTNSVLDPSVYDQVKPESLLAWQRVRTASAISSSGEEWFKTFRRYFSGTYANQYMIVDMKLFKPNSDLKNGTLWVIEEMPGLVVGADKTDSLRLGYWASYNVPYFKEVWEKSGYADATEKHGSFWTHDLNPRAKIFRRDQGSVVDMESLKKLMRSNKYLKDPYSFDGVSANPLYAICSRGDLLDGKNGNKKIASGCYDTKVTSFRHGALKLKSQVINGPTWRYSGIDLQPFNWSEFPEMSHKGLPEKYVFDFIKTEPKRFSFKETEKPEFMAQANHIRLEEEIE